MNARTVAAARRRAHVFRWDLDKTYLVSNFDSFRSLLKVPFERGTDKVTVPGATALMKALRRTAERNGVEPRVYFVTASPPQIGGPIKEKLALDGIVYEGIAFKDQVYHLVRGRFEALREQIGYKLTQLLSGGIESEEGAIELLFGDDWESDPFVYSVYADVMAGRLDRERTLAILTAANVDERYVEAVSDLLTRERPSTVVGAIHVLRQRGRPEEELRRFGPRMVWFDNYLECALTLHADGFVDVEGVIEVGSEAGLSPAGVAAAVEAVIARRFVRRASLARARARLVRAGVDVFVPRASVFARGLARVTRRLRRRPSIRASGAAPIPDYEALVERWAHSARKEGTQHAG